MKLASSHMRTQKSKLHPPKNDVSALHDENLDRSHRQAEATTDDRSHSVSEQSLGTVRAGPARHEAYLTSQHGIVELEASALSNTQ